MPALDDELGAGDGGVALAWQRHAQRHAALVYFAAPDDAQSALRATFEGARAALAQCLRASGRASQPTVHLYEQKGESALDSSRGGSIVFFERVPVDRTCLVKPVWMQRAAAAAAAHGTGLRGAATAGERFEGGDVAGRDTTAALLAFVNARCRTHCRPDGTLTALGRAVRQLQRQRHARRSRTGGETDGVTNAAPKRGVRRSKRRHRTLPAQHPAAVAARADAAASPSPPPPPPPPLPAPATECDVVDGAALSPGDFFRRFVARNRPVLVRSAGHLAAASRTTPVDGGSGGGGGSSGDGWAAGRLWSEAYLRRLLHNVSVHVKVAPADGFFEGPEDLTLWRGAGGEGRNVPAAVRRSLAGRGSVVLVRPAEVNLPFPELLSRLRGGAEDGASYYLEYSSIASYTPQLTRDLGHFPWAHFLAAWGGKEETGAERKGGGQQHNSTGSHRVRNTNTFAEQRNLWLGGRTLGKLHFDEFENILAVFDGTKNLTLFAPDDGVNLYEGHMREAKLSYSPPAAASSSAAAAVTQGVFSRDNLMSSTAMVNSPVDINKVDWDRYPRFAAAQPVHCTVAAGDALYLPAFWWHEVQSTPDSTARSDGGGRVLATNFWYTPLWTKEFPCAEGCTLDVNPAYLPHLLELSEMP